MSQRQLGCAAEEARKTDVLQSAADALNREGDRDLARLLGAIATAQDSYQSLDLPQLDEAMRWTPVVAIATKLARKVPR